MPRPFTPNISHCEDVLTLSGLFWEIIDVSYDDVACDETPFCISLHLCSSCHRKRYPKYPIQENNSHYLLLKQRAATNTLLPPSTGRYNPVGVSSYQTIPVE